MAMSNNVKDSVVLITGGSKGIGFATAVEAINNGASKVVIVARPSKDLSLAECELISLAGDSSRVVTIGVDLSRIDGVANIIDNLSKQNIKVNHLVNNAGYTKPAPLFEVEIADFKRTLAVNLLSPFMLIQELLKMNSELRTIVNIASTAGMKGRAGWSTYSASKAAMIALSDSLRDELSSEGVNVICLSPGRCATDLRKTLAPDEDPSTIMQPSQVAEIIMLYINDLGRLIDSENVVVRT